MSIERDPSGRVLHFTGPKQSPTCQGCPCAVNGVPKKAVPGFGTHGGLTIVGEAPAVEEVFQKKPFVGPSGKLMNKVFQRGGIDRNALYITNSLLCPRPTGDTELAKALVHCRPRLQAELHDVGPSAILTLGATANRALGLQATASTDARGTLQSSPLAPGVPVLSSVHPAALLRGGAGEVAGGGKNKTNVDAQMIFLQADTVKAYRVATGEIPAVWSDDIITVTEPEKMVEVMFALVADVHEWGMVGLDLEWVKDGRITWLGLGTAKRAFSFWFPVMPPEALAAARDLLANPEIPKVIHNLQADKEVWERENAAGAFEVWRREVGWTIEGEINDTMLAHHAACPGIAHDLQQVVSQYLVVPPWKVWRAQEEKEAMTKAKEEIKAAKKAEKQRAHEERNAARAAEREAKKAARLAEHEARNAARARLKEEKQKLKHEERAAREVEKRYTGEKKDERTNGEADGAAGGGGSDLKEDTAPPVAAGEQERASAAAPGVEPARPALTVVRVANYNPPQNKQVGAIGAALAARRQRLADKLDK